MKELKIDGVYLIENFFHEDSRGCFVKPFSSASKMFKDLQFNISEVYYSISHKNTIRGMHFQHPPADHQKLIYLTKGKIVDVLLDLRKKSSTYKQFIAVDLVAHKEALFIPKGIAHGFLSKEDGTTIVYNQSTVYSRTHDDGILWDSFGFEWGVNSPELSERDRSFDTLEDFISPF